MAWNPADGSNVSLASGEELFALAIKTTGKVDLSESMTISSKVTPAEAYLANDSEADVNLIFENNKIAGRFELLQNRPNPWSGETVIGFSVPETAQTSLSVFDVNGRLMKQISGLTSKGYHEWSINVSDFPSTGLYYYKLEMYDRSVIRKMILMD
jgi:hypothetical protein